VWSNAFRIYTVDVVWNIIICRAVEIKERDRSVWNITKANQRIAGGGSDAGDDIIEPGGGVVGETPTVGDSGEVDAVHVDAVGGGDVVDDGSGEGDVIVAGGVVAGVLRIAGGAGVHAVDGAPVLARQGARGAKRTVSAGAVPAFPTIPLVFIRPISMNHNETLRIFIGHFIQSSRVLLIISISGKPMEVHHKGSGSVVGGGIVGREVEVVMSLNLSLVGVIDLNLELVMMSWVWVVRKSRATSSTGGGEGGRYSQT